LIDIALYLKKAIIVRLRVFSNAQMEPVLAITINVISVMIAVTIQMRLMRFVATILDVISKMDSVIGVRMEGINGH